MARRTQHRKLKTKFFVLGDGQTEQYYLDHLKKLKKYTYTMYPSFFNDITIERVESKIDELLSGNCDMVIYFTDYDTIVKQRKQEKFKKLKKKYARIAEVRICESMPCIEYWFLLHYIKTTAEFVKAKDVEHELRKNMNGYKKRKSYLQNPGWVEELCSNGRQEYAINNAAEILKQKESQPVGKHFPFTRAHLAIDSFEQRKR